MKTNITPNADSEAKDSQIYISIDHLKKGIYHLHLMCKEKVIKTVTFKKREL